MMRRLFSGASGSRQSLAMAPGGAPARARKEAVILNQSYGKGVKHSDKGNTNDRRRSNERKEGKNKNEEEKRGENYKPLRIASFIRDQ